MSEIPANYDNSSLSIDPGTLNSAENIIKIFIDEISANLEIINHALSNLNLSWAGQSASEAQKFNDEWTNAVQELFGTKKDPKSGALSVLASGISKASQNYSQTEEDIKNKFHAFGSGFSSGGSSPVHSAIDDPSGNDHTTSVDEVYPSPFAEF